MKISFGLNCEKLRLELNELQLKKLNLSLPANKNTKLKSLRLHFKIYHHGDKIDMGPIWSFIAN